uniref:uncharacterized protein LOC101308699 n=1 Tax=Fragaria vesca subsp. vesca TaxID=101020 RepID=UPI0005CA3DD9|nr:PREDICTED: uncharacterized protein LOC101308699 [Fragaria vesca subsp. vesca]
MVEALVCTSDWLKSDPPNLYKDPSEDELAIFVELEEIERAIKEFKIVPESTILQEWTGCAMGFGYDPKSGDYTIVNVVSYDEEVYEERLVHSTPKAEGIFYWLGYEQNKEFISCYRRQEEEYVRQVIVLFDTSDEVFRSMLLPDSFYEPSFGVYTMRLGRWKESIALYGFHCFTYFEIWVNDGNGSWTKHATFEPLEDYFVLSLAFWKSEEVIMVANDGRIVSYNVATVKIKYLPIHGVYPGSFEAVVCLNSIVSVNRGNKLASEDV